MNTHRSFIVRSRRITEHRRFIIIAIIDAIVLGLSACALQNGNDDNSKKSAAAISILRALGVTAVDNPPPVSMITGGGTTVSVDPAVWQPLRYERTVFWTHDELLTVGAAIGSSYVRFYEDADQTYAYNTPWTDSSWADAGKNLSCAGDFDGDGIEEALVLTYTAAAGWQLRRYDNGGSTQILAIATTDIPAANADYIDSSVSWWRGDAYMVTCQIDADDAREFAVALGDAVWLFNLNTGTAGSWSVSLAATRNFGAYIFGFAAGDCNGDGLDELCVCRGDQYYDATYAVYDSDFDQCLTGSPVSLTGNLFSYCDFGDVDGDGLDELVISTMPDLAGGLFGFPVTCYVYNWNGSGFTNTHTLSNGKYNISGFFAPLCLDMDGDGMDEIFSVQSLYNYQKNTNTFNVLMRRPRDGPRQRITFSHPISRVTWTVTAATTLSSLTRA
jgi:hypothetical protein